jgi:hypothetical protein
MTEYPNCDHGFPDSLSEVDPKCWWGFCTAVPVSCIVYIGRSIGERDLLEGGRKLFPIPSQVAVRANSDRSDPGVPVRQIPADLRGVFAWIDSEGRCCLGCFSVSTGHSI